ncbi:hypothetical protein G7054_g5852 [Neopestalotiopsis clavispora]|nr:hypothetical protein G7054_g5852 [Neopestalotiopsis clavispora]
MQFSTLALTALLGAFASAQTVHVVSVSTANNNSLVFTPDNIQVPAGDMVQFQFRAGNHSVAQSTFDAPCSPISQHTNQTGAFSGFMPVAASSSTGMIPTWTIMVANTNPMWFYCATGKHCQSGMVMVINENTAANATRSLTEFKKLASAATANVGPLEPPPRAATPTRATRAPAPRARAPRTRPPAAAPRPAPPSAPPAPPPSSSRLPLPCSWVLPWPLSCYKHVARWKKRVLWSSWGSLLILSPFLNPSM